MIEVDIPKMGLRTVLRYAELSPENQDRLSGIWFEQAWQYHKINEAEKALRQLGKEEYELRKGDNVSTTRGKRM